MTDEQPLRSVQYSFLPGWQALFITSLAPEDRCHLKGSVCETARIVVSQLSGKATKQPAGGSERRMASSWIRPRIRSSLTVSRCLIRLAEMTTNYGFWNPEPARLAKWILPTQLTVRSPKCPGLLAALMPAVRLRSQDCRRFVNRPSSVVSRLPSENRNAPAESGRSTSRPDRSSASSNSKMPCRKFSPCESSRESVIRIS